MVWKIKSHGGGGGGGREPTLRRTQPGRRVHPQWASRLPPIRRRTQGPAGAQEGCVPAAVLLNTVQSFQQQGSYQGSQQNPHKRYTLVPGWRSS